MSGRPHGWPTEPQELLLRAALLGAPEAQEAWTRWKRDNDVATTDHDSGRLFGLLGRNLLALGVDDPDIGVLKSAYRHHWLASHQRLTAAGHALRVLADAGIETMVLKGAALGQRYYRDVGARPMYDVDVLVRPERARDAAHALMAGGWTQFLHADIDVLLPVAHGTSYRDPDLAGVDLHWYALWSSGDDGDFWAAAEPIEVGGVATLAQCAADQLLHVCVHGIWSDGQRVRWVADAAMVLRAAPDLDWERVVDRARARGLTLPLALALGYLRERFAQPVPGPVLAALRATPRGVFERAGHRAWMAPHSRARMLTLTLERYRRQRALPPGPTRGGALPGYLWRYAEMILELGPGERVLPGLVRKFRPGARAGRPEPA